MKKILNVWICCFFVVSHLPAQNQAKNPAKPLWIVDDKIAGTAVIGVDPNDIETMNVDKNFSIPDKNISGKIEIKTKYPGKYEFVSVADVLKQFGINAGPAVIFINETALTDTAFVRIDKQQILSVESIANWFDYLRDCKNLSVIRINIRKEEMRIRGDLAMPETD